MFGSTQLNPQERALAATPPPYQAGSQVLPLAMKALTGTQGVPNPMASALASTPAGALGTIAGGVADALGAPLPSLTATVHANPSVTFGSKYVPQLVNDSMAGTSSQGKVGAFTVSSGNSNAENRGQLAVGSAPPWVWWVVAGAVGIGLLVWLLRRTK